jgi:signal transduction histidine kinase/DNA-binding response OmpR family regulator
MNRASRHWPIVLIGIVTVLPLALLTYFSLQMSTDAVEREVESRLESTASLSATVVAQDLRSLTELAESYAGRPSLIDAASNLPGTRSREQIRFHLGELRSARSGVSVAFFVALDGRLIDIDPATPSIIGQDFSFRDWYRGLTRTRRPYISEAIIGQATGNPRVVVASTYVRSPEGRPLAIVAAAYSLAALQRLSNELAQAQAVKLKVTDQRGVLVAQSGGLPKALQSRSSDPRVRAALGGRSGITQLDTVDGRRVSAYTPVPQFGWTVTASVPANTAFAAVERLRTAVLGVVALLSLGLLGGLVLLGKNLRARTRAEEQAQREVRINEAVLEATTDGIALVDANGCIVAANGTFERFLGDMVGRPLTLERDQPGLGALAEEIAERTTDPQAYLSGVGRIAEDPTYVGLDEFQIAETGRAFLRYTAPVLDVHGEELGRLAVLREVTAEREAERLKSDLLATVSHELRTPLTGVLGFAELARRPDLDPATRDRYLATIHGEAKRLTALINDFLDLQRIEAGAFTLALEPLDLRTVLQAGTHLFETRSEAHTLELDVHEEPLLVAGDRERLAQVLENLLSNALKFSPAGGTVRLAAESLPGFVRVSVHDDGLGIPADQQGRLFTKFFRVDTSDTRRIGGTGLGLALCREIVEAHAGEIGFESVEGAGSTFWFTLPAGVRRDAAGPARVLVIEDDPGAAAFLVESLSGDGFEIETAATGEEGLRRALEDPPAAICLDIFFPHGIQGWEVLERLKENPATAHVPVVVCTGRNNRERAAALGAADFLSKPLSAEQLREAVRRVAQPPACILVVDDDVTVRRLVVETLRRDGLELIEAADGEEALTAVAERRPDAIVLDLLMPRVDGFEVLERLQADPETRTIPVIVLTAQRLSADERRTVTSRAAALLGKADYSAEDLRRLIANAVGDAS